MKTLIIGGGIAGLTIAHQLRKRKQEFVLITEKENFSTRIAAGLINPLVFRRMLKSWEADLLIPYLQGFYKEIENITHTPFFHPTLIRRVFSSQDEAELWNERVKDDAYKHYLTLDTNPNPDYIIDKFGQGFVLQGAYINSEVFLSANRDFFENQISYERFDFDLLDLESKSYRGMEFDKIIFAEGYKAMNNPFFNYLPMGQTKGELLDIKSNQLKEDEILNRKCFVLHIGENNFKLGATFEWETTNLDPTEEKKEELLEKYNLVSTAEFEIINHKTGIRPTSADRRPLMGEHPELKDVFVFNGLGTKGYMLAPYFSQQLVEHIFDGGELRSEVNINRFHKRFRNRQQKG